MFPLIWWNDTNFTLSVAKHRHTHQINANHNLGERLLNDVVQTLSSICLLMVIHLNVMYYYYYFCTNVVIAKEQWDTWRNPLAKSCYWIKLLYSSSRWCKGKCISDCETMRKFYFELSPTIFIAVSFIYFTRKLIISDNVDEQLFWAFLTLK